MKKPFLERIAGREIQAFVVFTIALFWLAAFLTDTPIRILEGMVKIVSSRDALITDYFELGGYGAAFFNGGLVLMMGYLLLKAEKAMFTGLTMAALFMNAGFALFGKNPLNVWPILFGTFLYSRFHHTRFSRYIYTALFGTCLAPFITEIIYILPYSKWVNMAVSIVVGILIGFILPPLSMHTASMHMGYNLFNVGFSAGIVAFVMVCILRSFGLESEATLIWKEGVPMPLIIVLYGYFLLAFVYGLVLSKGQWKGWIRIMRHPGRAVADFVYMDGVGATFLNMGLVGVLATSYILLIGGDLSGPVVGAILTVFGFGAFGVHLRNYVPVLLGVLLATFITVFEVTAPAIQLAAVFSMGVAPIAGQFGPVAGFLAGFLHLAIVSCTNDMYGGLNLYNNGFSCGWVAIIMVPFVESFIKRFDTRKKNKGGHKE
ncbi:MAG: DUF1576 domain-containing protein [Lachnospiraceae bacterium]|nr:DUF1576 domain-containing protein [Lachnospiraceae bacterium]